jgi:hypothetical protein
MLENESLLRKSTVQLQRERKQDYFPLKLDTKVMQSIELIFIETDHGPYRFEVLYSFLRQPWAKD